MYVIWSFLPGWPLSSLSHSHWTISYRQVLLQFSCLCSICVSLNLIRVACMSMGRDSLTARGSVRESTEVKKMALSPSATMSSLQLSWGMVTRLSPIHAGIFEEPSLAQVTRSSRDMSRSQSAPALFPSSSSALCVLPEPSGAPCLSFMATGHSLSSWCPPLNKYSLFTELNE